MSSGVKLPTIGCWADVEMLLRDRPAGVLLRVPRGWLEHPRAHGMKASAAWPAGQVIDYWKKLDDKLGLHVSAYHSFYMVRLQYIDDEMLAGRGKARTGPREKNARESSSQAARAVEESSKTDESVTVEGMTATGLTSFDDALDALDDSSTEAPVPELPDPFGVPDMPQRPSEDEDATLPLEPAFEEVPVQLSLDDC